MNDWILAPQKWKFLCKKKTEEIEFSCTKIANLELTFQRETLLLKSADDFTNLTIKHKKLISKSQMTIWHYKVQLGSTAKLNPFHSLHYPIEFDIKL